MSLILLQKVPRSVNVSFRTHRGASMKGRGGDVTAQRPSQVLCYSTQSNPLAVKSFTVLRSFQIQTQFPIVPVAGSKNDFAPLNYTKQQIRYKHGARKGLHLQNLDEIAHRNEHAFAEERRAKKKEKTLARKGGKKAGPLSEEGKRAAANPDSDESEQFAEEQMSKEGGAEDWEEEEEEEEEEAHDETVLPVPREVKDKMMKHVDGFRDYLKTIRGGQPTVEMFDDILVRDAYGRGTGDVPLKAVAQIVFAAPTLANATCFDPSTTKAVAIAIRDLLDLNPIEEEGTGAIKIPIPRVSMEVRQQVVSNIHKRAEQFRIRIRNHRRSALEVVKKGVAGKMEGVSKDDAFRVQQEIEGMTDVVIKELNKVLEKKEQDILSV